MRTTIIGMPALALSSTLPCAASAQTLPPPQSASTSSQQVLTDQQLDALVAPIALYPDALLSEILMASTYPLEVIEADRWLNENKSLKGDALKASVDQQSWDDSVKSLAATPSVLDMMSQKLDWTSWTPSSGCAVKRRQTTSSRRTNSRRFRLSNRTAGRSS